MSGLINVAIIGYGNSARTFHIPFVVSLPELYNLHTIQQRPSSKGPLASEAHPNARIAPTFEAVFDGLPPRSLVIITTSNSTHCDFALQSMAKGHHVVVEKPAALNMEQAESLLKASKEHQVVCAAFQNRRLDNDFLTLQSLLAPSRSGEPSPIGQPTLIESRFDRYRPFSKGGWREQEGPENGGGMLWDLGAHLIDQAIVLFGPPERVTAFVSSARGQLPEHVDDDFLVHLHYPTSAPLGPDSLGPAPGTRIAGPKVTVGASCLSAHVDAEQPRWRVEGTRGSVSRSYRR
jgi:predicted dehydrogenase